MQRHDGRRPLSDFEDGDDDADIAVRTSAE